MLSRDLGEDLLEADDGLGIVGDAEIAFDDEFEVGGAAIAIVSGDDEDAASGGAGDEIAFGGRGRGEPAFDACEGEGEWALYVNDRMDREGGYVYPSER